MSACKKRAKILINKRSFFVVIINNRVVYVIINKRSFESFWMCLKILLHLQSTLTALEKERERENSNSKTLF